MNTDLSAAELLQYRSDQVDPADFDEFWADTIAAARSLAADPVIVRVDTPLTSIEVYDVTFSGSDGHPIRGWLRVPAGARAPLPAVVEFIGYGGGRGHALENLLWASAGYVSFHMDTRGQGSGWSQGDTPDPAGSGPQHPGMMTRGIDAKESYYYRRVFTDAVRAIDTVRSLDQVDAGRVAVYGGSQGGGIALAVSGLVDGLAAVAPRVPFLCDFPRATRITDAHPYREIALYLAVHRDKVAQAHGVLAYFDGVNFAKRAQAPALFSASLMDPICPPSTVFGAFHAYAGDKDISLWEYNGHEGGGIVDYELALAFFTDAFATSGAVSGAAAAV